MKENRYYVIGGQYDRYNYGGTPTLLGAKRLAGMRTELWNNWQGFHVPQIYAAEDCAMAVNFYGEQMLPKPDTWPVAVWDERKRRWQPPYCVW